jgi:hypothetical protein
MPNGREQNRSISRRRRAAWTAVLSMLLGCGGSDPASQVEKASSWAATTRELAIQRRVGAIGRAYTEDLLDKGRQDVEKVEQSLDPSSLPAEVRTSVPSTVARLDTLMARTADAVRRGDVVALGVAAAVADTLGGALDSLRATMGSK